MMSAIFRLCAIIALLLEVPTQAPAQTYPNPQVPATDGLTAAPIARTIPLSVLHFGAKCDGVTNDAVAFQAAANLGRQINVPAGICKLNATINVVTGTQFIGTGRPPQFTYLPTTGTTLDFINAPALSDGFAAAGTVQMVRFADLQIERAPRHGINLAAVFSSFDRITLAYNGGDGLLLNNSYLSSVSSALLASNGGNGFVATATGQYTTLQINNSESAHNTGDGWQISNINSMSFISSSADNNGGYGFSALRTSTNTTNLDFYSTDSESNAKSGYYFNHVTAQMTGATAANNNTSATVGETNFALADQASLLTISSSYDLASTTANSLSATNSSVITNQSNRWLSILNADASSHISTLGDAVTILPTTGSISFNAANTAANYALYGDIGNTIINAPSNALISFRISNATMATIDSTGTLAAVSLRGTASSTISNIVATFGTCNAGNRGKRGVVSDATTPTFLGTLTGGGAIVSPVFCNGTAWVSG